MNLATDKALPVLQDILRLRGFTQEGQEKVSQEIIVALGTAGLFVFEIETKTDTKRTRKTS